MKQLLLFILVALASVGMGTTYTLTMNPELKWLFGIDQIKRSSLIDSEGGRFLFVGGSGTLFGADARTIEQITGVRSLNLGLHAGLGAPFLLGYADTFAREGDMLVISLEAGLLQGSTKPAKLGRQFAMVLGDPKMAHGGALANFSKTDYLETVLSPASPGLYQVVSHVGKIVLNSPSYRFRVNGVDGHGYAWEKVLRPHDTASQRPGLSDAWVEFLRDYVAHMDRRGVTVVYAMPWVQVTADQRAESVAATSEFMKRINCLMPIVEDETGGLITEPTWFADTPLHLSEQGAAIRSEWLGRALLNKQVIPIRDCSATGK